MDCSKDYDRKESGPIAGLKSLGTIPIFVVF